MRRALVLLVIFLVLFGTMLPNPAWARGPWRGGHGGGHHDGWWLPGAILGGLAAGAVAVVTAPFVALSAVAAAPPVAYAPPPVTYAPPVVYAPPPVYAAPAPAYQPAPSYAPQVAAVRREVVGEEELVCPEGVMRDVKPSVLAVHTAHLVHICKFPHVEASTEIGRVGFERD